MFKVNVIGFFDIFFNDVYVLNRSGLTGSYDNSIIFQADKIFKLAFLRCLLILMMRNLA